MTTYELASAVAVIKNLLIMEKITTVEAASTLWALINEASPLQDVHYVPGTSDVVDKLIARKCG